MSACFAALHFGRFRHITDIERRLLDVRFWGVKRTSRRERGQCVDRHDLKDEVWEFA
jgi:hypothetical protein